MKFLSLVLLLTLVVNNVKANSEDYSIKLFTGKDIEQVISFVSETWRTIFSEYPYLYVGSVEEANGYFEWLSNLPHTAIAVAYSDERPVGFLSGISFVGFSEHAKGSMQLFELAGLKPAEYYYFGEVIVLPEYRGHRLSNRLFKVLEDYARSLQYTKGCFVEENHEVHPLKPKSYRELNNLWTYLGYTKTKLDVSFSWPTIQPDQTIQNQEHKLAYWIKNFSK